MQSSHSAVQKELALKKEKHGAPIGFAHTDTASDHFHSTSSFDFANQQSSPVALVSEVEKAKNNLEQDHKIDQEAENLITVVKEHCKWLLSSVKEDIKKIQKDKYETFKIIVQKTTTLLGTKLTIKQIRVLVNLATLKENAHIPYVELAKAFEKPEEILKLFSMSVAYCAKGINPEEVSAAEIFIAQGEHVFTTKTVKSDSFSACRGIIVRGEKASLFIHVWPGFTTMPDITLVKEKCGDIQSAIEIKGMQCAFSPESPGFLAKLNCLVTTIHTEQNENFFVQYNHNTGEVVTGKEHFFKIIEHHLCKWVNLFPQLAPKSEALNQPLSRSSKASAVIAADSTVFYSSESAMQPAVQSMSQFQLKS